MNHPIRNHRRIRNKRAALMLEPPGELRFITERLEAITERLKADATVRLEAETVERLETAKTECLDAIKVECPKAEVEVECPKADTTVRAESVSSAQPEA